MLFRSSSSSNQHFTAKFHDQCTVVGTNDTTLPETLGSRYDMATLPPDPDAVLLPLTHDPTEDSHGFISLLTNQHKIAPNDICRVLSPPKKQGSTNSPSTTSPSTTTSSPNSLVINGVTYIASIHCISY